jgi:hypothetical protein
MQSDTLGAAVLGLGMVVVVLAAVIWPPVSVDILWTVTASDKISSRPQLVRAAFPFPARQSRVAGAL